MAAESLPDWGVEEVVVQAHHAGPLVWRAHRGTAEVYLLPIVGPMPKDLAWDHAGLAPVVAGARRIWLEPRASVGLVEGAWFLLMQRDQVELPDGPRLEAQLPDDLRRRFVALRSRLGKDADRYEDDLPAWAGLILFFDFLRARDWSGSEPDDTIRDLADHAEVKPLGTYDALPFVKELKHLSPEENRVCLANALDDIEAEDAHQPAAARAWAAGDLAAMKANYSDPKIFACLQHLPHFAEAWKKSVADSTGAVEAALDAGGTTLMVVSLGALLRSDGVLERLTAAGIAVDAPGGK